MTISMRQGGAAAASGKLEHVTQHRIEGLIFLEHGARIGDEAGSVRLNAHSFWGWGLWDSVTAIPGSSNGAFCPIHSQGPLLSQLLSASSLCLLHPSAQELPTFVLFPGSDEAPKEAKESQELLPLVP